MADPVPSVAVATGSLVVTGTATNFIAAENDLFVAGGAVVPIASRDGPTQITLKQPWPAASLAGSPAFSLLSLGEYWRSAISINKRFADLLAKWEIVSPFRFDAAGPLAERDNYNNQPKGFVYIAVDPLPVRIFIKLANTNSAADWSLAIYIGSGGQVEFQEALDQERSRAIQAEAALGRRIDDIAVGADPNVRGDLNAEIARSTSKDAQHDNQIGSLRSDLTAEASGRMSGDTVLGGRIDAETSGRVAADNALGGRIDTEINARLTADASLSQRIATEESARTAKDSLLDAVDAGLRIDLTAERTTARAAEAALGGRIDVETAARIDFDTRAAPLLPLTDGAAYEGAAAYALRRLLGPGWLDKFGRLILGVAAGRIKFGMPLAVPGATGERPEAYAQRRGLGAALLDGKGRAIAQLLRGSVRLSVPLAVPGQAQDIVGAYALRRRLYGVLTDRFGRRIAELGPDGIALGQPLSAPGVVSEAAGRYSLRRRLQLSIMSRGGRTIADLTGGVARIRVPVRFDRGIVNPDAPSRIEAHAWFGDSMTQYGPAEDHAAIIMLPSYNLGSAGLTSTGIAARQGGARTPYRSATGLIPADTTPVRLLPAVAGPNLYIDNRSNSVVGTLGGVHGTLSWDGQKATFTRDTAGTAIALAAAEPFTFDPVTTPDQVLARYHALCCNHIWGGRNDVGGSNDVLMGTVLLNLRAMVALLPPGARFLISPIFNQRTEPKGSSTYAAIMAVNAAIEAEWPNNYLRQPGGMDLREYVVSKRNPADSTDAADYAADCTPTSLRNLNDPLHMNAAGNRVIAGFTVAVELRKQLVSLYLEGNLLAGASDLTHPAWQPGYTLASKSAAAFPDPRATVTLVRETADAGYHYINQGPLTVPSTGQFRFAVALKAAGRTKGHIAFNTNSAGAQAVQPFDLATGTLPGGYSYSGSTFVSGRIVDLLDGWWLIILIGSHEGKTDRSVQIEFYDDSSNFSYAGDPTKGMLVGPVSMLAL